MSQQPQSDTQLQLNRIEHRGELVDLRLQNADKTLDRIAELLEGVVQKIAALSEQITRQENVMEQRFTAIDRLTANVDRVAATAETQTANIAALSTLASQILQRVPMS